MICCSNSSETAGPMTLSSVTSAFIGAGPRDGGSKKELLMSYRLDWFVRGERPSVIGSSLGLIVSGEAGF